MEVAMRSEAAVGLEAAMRSEAAVGLEAAMRSEAAMRLEARWLHGSLTKVSSSGARHRWLE